MLNGSSRISTSGIYPDLSSQARWERASTANNSGSQYMYGSYNDGRYEPEDALLQETLHTILRGPIETRFSRLEQMLIENDPRRLQNIFAELIESVFSFHPSPQQRRPESGYPSPPIIPKILLCDINPEQHSLYQSVFSLLHPEGPIFRLITNLTYPRSLLAGPRFHFPTSRLAYSVQEKLEGGYAPPWYRDKVSADYSETDGMPEFISLSAFDFYFVHFAYHLVNPDLRVAGPARPDCVFMALLDIYSDYFFNARTIVDNQNSQIYAQKPASQHSSFFGSSRGLFRDGTPTAQPPPVREKVKPLATSENLECIATIFAEFWLNTSGFGRVSKYRTVAKERDWSTRNGYISSPLTSPLGKRKTSHFATRTEFPPTTALQAFRQTVKIIHEFMFNQSNDLRGIRKNPETSLLEMKRHIIPQIIQRPLYDLLKSAIKMYPMDASFRFVYELWLSYIQPWRYENGGPNLDASKPDDVALISQDPRWQTFISDNILFYTGLFQCFLERMLHVDFQAPFNALAVYRVTKIFWDSGIFNRILSIEAGLITNGRSVGQHSLSSPSKTTVRNHFSELEGQSFVYTSIRSAETVTKVISLLKTLESENRKIQNQLRKPANGGPHLTDIKSTAVNSFKNLLGLIANPIFGLQLQPEELERMSRHLGKAIECLCGMYEIDRNELATEASRSPAPNDSQSVSAANGNGSLSFPAVNGQSQPKARKSVGRRSMAIGLMETRNLLTEPERRPAQDWEIKWLIPVLNYLSDGLNEQYGEKIVELYNGQDFVSRLVHPLIEPPHEPVITSADNESTRPLPARISLRPLASKHKVYSLLFVMFFMWIADFGIFRGTFWLVAVPMFFLIVNAILEPFLHQRG